ncbi:hypothetical protein LP419_30510 [Massilia sp. H-1]|nr:hypothetical protein LP419_30510 [Massilia sp. H-1]
MAEPGIVDMLMDNIMLILGVLAAIAVAVGGFVFMKSRRQDDGHSPSEPSILGAPTDQAHSLFAETGGQSVDTSNSVFNSSFAPSASQLDTNEVDPVAEADVYIAYGRDAQAEEILEGSAAHPSGTLPGPPETARDLRRPQGPAQLRSAVERPVQHDQGPGRRVGASRRAGPGD